MKHIWYLGNCLTGLIKSKAIKSSLFQMAGIKLVSPFNMELRPACGLFPFNTHKSRFEQTPDKQEITIHMLLSSVVQHRARALSSAYIWPCLLLFLHPFPFLPHPYYTLIISCSLFSSCLSAKVLDRDCTVSTLCLVPNTI